MKLCSLAYLCLIALIPATVIADVHADIQSWVSGGKVSWSSAGRSRAGGLNIALNYPSSWLAKDPTHPNILMNFVSENGRGQEMLMLKMIQMPEAFKDRILTPEEKDAMVDLEVVKAFLPEAGTIESYKKSKIDGEPCAMVEYSSSNERVGIRMQQKSLFVFVPHSRVLLTMNGFVGCEEKYGKDVLDRKFEETRPLFLLMMGSCIFEDKWKK